MHSQIKSYKISTVWDIYIYTHTALNQLCMIMCVSACRGPQLPVHMTVYMAYYILSALHAYYVHVMYTYQTCQTERGEQWCRWFPKEAYSSYYSSVPFSLSLSLPVPSTGALQLGHFSIRAGLGSGGLVQKTEPLGGSLLGPCLPGLPLSRFRSELGRKQYSTIASNIHPTMTRKKPEPLAACCIDGISWKHSESVQAD